MVETSLKQKTLSYINQLDDEKMQLLFSFVQTLTNRKEAFTNTKTIEQRREAEKALSELEHINFRLKEKTSLDGRSEKTAHLWEKYESFS